MIKHKSYKLFFTLKITSTYHLLITVISIIKTSANLIKTLAFLILSVAFPISSGICYVSAHDELIHLPTDSADVAKLVMTSQSECQLFMQAKDLSASTSKDRHAWSETSYDTLDRPMKVTTPRDVWHTAGKAKTTKYISKAANSVRLYHAPRDRIFMQDPNLRKEGLHRFFVYDRAGRMVIQGVSGMCTRGPAVNFADYMTHELYGHGYFYELNLKGYDVNPFHDYRSVMVEGDLMPDCSIPDCVSIRVDFNTKLDNQINIVTSIGKRNYNSRFR